MQQETETLKIFSSHSMKSKLSYVTTLDDQQRKADVSIGQLTQHGLDAYVWV